MKARYSYVALGLLVALILVMGAAAPTAAQQARAVFNQWVIVDSLTATKGNIATEGIHDLVSADDVTVGDDVLATGDLRAGDNVQVADLLLTVPSTYISVTMNGTINPVSSYQPLRSAGTVNTSSITIKDAGTRLTLVNETNTSIVLSDTGTLKLSGNLTLGQYDSVTLLSDGTNWIQQATSNN